MMSLYNDKHDGYWRNKINVNEGNTQGLWRTFHAAYWVIPLVKMSVRVLPTTLPSISRTRSIPCVRLLPFRAAIVDRVLRCDYE